MSAPYEFMARGFASGDSLNAAVAKLGLEGWEPVTMANSDEHWPSGLVVIFRRPRK